VMVSERVCVCACFGIMLLHAGGCTCMCAYKL